LRGKAWNWKFLASKDLFAAFEHGVAGGQGTWGIGIKIRFSLI